MGTVVVTGAAAGIGLAVAIRAVQDGRDVVLFDRDAERVSAAAEGLGRPWAAVDVTDRVSLAAAFRHVAEKQGPIGGLVNCAGISLTGPSATFDPDDWRRVIEINMSGTFFACQSAFEYLADPASIVNVTSVLAAKALAGRAAYASTKAAVVALTRVLAVEWAPNGVRVNAIGPAWTETPLLRELIASGAMTMESMTSRIPMGRIAAVDDITGTIAFLLSPDSAFVTGQTIYVDGGYVVAG